MINTYVTEIDGRYYAFAMTDNSNQVLSIGADNPPIKSGGSRWFASYSESGIKYVATPSPNRQAAVSKARRNGNYFGEI